MTSSDKGVRVSNCPIKLEICFPSCFWRKGDRCTLRSKRGRRIARIKKKE